ncbi:MAG: hypothetical protein LBN99_02500 [Oscillospiraceae bacterium]|jgi:hypothetical protein|nr:hypothetical protein [Oscillospiraceae bacterium]
MRTKKVLFLLILAATALISLSVAAAVAAQPDGYITVGTASGERGDTVEVALTFGAKTSFLCLDTMLEYDATALELASVDAGALYNSSRGDNIAAYRDSGYTALLSADTEYAVTLTFRILGGARDGKNTVAIKAESGYFDIWGGAMPSGANLALTGGYVTVGVPGGEYEVTLAPSARDVNAGETFKVGVAVDGRGNRGAFDARLDFDAEKLEVVDVESAGGVFGYAVDGDELSVIRTGGAIPFEGAAPLATVTFRVKTSGFTGNETAEIALAQAGVGEEYFAALGGAAQIRVHNLTVSFAAGEGVTLTPVTAFAKYGEAGLYTSNGYAEAFAVPTPEAAGGYRLAEPLWGEFTSEQIAATEFTDSAAFTATAVRQWVFGFVGVEGATDVTGVENGGVIHGESVTFRLPGVDRTGYETIVEYAVDGGEAVALTPVGGVYTIPGDAIMGAITVSVRYLLSGEIEFVAGGNYGAAPDGYKLITVRIAGSRAGVVYSFDGEAMYWSEKYGALVYIVADGLTEEQARDRLSVAVGAGNDAVTYSGDIDATAGARAVDAQIVHDLYATDKYASPGSLGVLQRLEADVNGDGRVDIADVRMVQSIYLRIFP